MGRLPQRTGHARVLVSAGKERFIVLNDLQR
jgi:hypothetical protein